MRIRFGPFTLDFNTRQLTRGGRDIHLAPKAFDLLAALHVIGRDANVEIRLDQSTVSRRHAQLVVTAEGAVLEAFVSKNGTFRGRHRVSAPIQLADGDAIRVGSVVMTFRVRASFGSEETQPL